MWVLQSMVHLLQIRHVLLCCINMKMQMFRCTKIYYLQLFAARINRSKVNYKNIHADIKSLPSAQTFISCGKYVTAKLSPNMTFQCS